ncbi:MAG: phenylalanine--tRNA ligase subunit beta [Candidatus Omnitrophica bacterium]|nr:phenylalanine--tRNA ligase subunit beta [Candidatus Omnitrophota bacterium]
MRVSYNWLKEYVDIRLAPEKLAELLTMSGLTVESLQPLGADHIFEIEVTSNRPDWLSVIGIAREVAAICGSRLKLPAIVPVRSQDAKGGARIIVDDRKLCPRYTGRVIRNVKIGESPHWLKAKLEAMGLRPVNNAVDITNFCLFETGEPMHVFDLDKVAGGTIIVRRAKKGEKIFTIDGVERALDDPALVIADREKPIAIAGVMGGADTEVTASTKNILLEAAYFDPVSVRRTSRKLGISTESSYRFERKVDLDSIASSSDRATALIAELCGGAAGELFDVGEKARPEKTAHLRYERLNSLLGLHIEPPKAAAILRSLGLETKGSSRDAITAKIPSFRYDLDAETDLIEEISRIYGYDRIPQTIPVVVEQPIRVPSSIVIGDKIRDILAGFGLDEIMTYSLLGRRSLEAAGVGTGDAVEIKNPLSNEQEVMRQTLIPGMLNAVRWNINRKNKDLKLFELGKVYIKRHDGGFNEHISLSIGLAGQASAGWLEGARQESFFDVKGIAESLLAELGISDVSFRPAQSPFLSAGAAASLESEGKTIGILGQVKASVLSEFDIKEKVYVLELSADELFSRARLEKTFSEIPRYPSVVRDISLIADAAAHNEDLLSAVRAAGSPLLKEAQLIDRYIGSQIPDGKVSLTYRIEYQDPTRTLEDKDITPVHARILQELERRFGAKLR